MMAKTIVVFQYCPNDEMRVSTGDIVKDLALVRLWRINKFLKVVQQCVQSISIGKFNDVEILIGKERIKMPCYLATTPDLRRIPP